MKLEPAKRIASKQKDKSQWDALEYLEQASNPNSKEAARYLVDRNQKRAAAQFQKEQEIIAEMQAQGKKEEYCQFLSAVAVEMIAQAGFGADWMTHVVSTKDNDAIKIYGRGYQTKLGIVIVIKDPTGRVFVQAMSPTGQGDQDLEMIARFVRSAENTLEKYNNTGGTMSDLLRPLSVIGMS